jgi:hypothetical protein
MYQIAKHAIALVLALLITVTTFHETIAVPQPAAAALA